MSVQRKTKFNRHRVDAILESIRNGNNEVVSARAATISDRGWRKWVREGRECLKLREDDEPLTREQQEMADFYVELQQARSRAEQDMVEIVRKAAVKSWQAACWWLERKSPHRWGRFNRHEFSGPGGKPIQTQATVTLEDLEAVHKTIASNTQDVD